MVYKCTKVLHLDINYCIFDSVIWQFIARLEYYLLDAFCSWNVLSHFDEYFHFVTFSLCAKLWKMINLLSPKKFRQINSLVISFLKPLISRIFRQKCVRQNRSNFHTTVVCEKFSLTKEKFRQINSLVIYLVKPLLSRNFCQTLYWKLRQFSLTHFWQNFRESNWFTK